MSAKEAQQLASRFGCEYIETSSKTRQNVDEVFLECVRALARLHPPPRRNVKRCKKTCSLLGGAEVSKLPGGFVTHPLNHPTKLTQRFRVDLESAARLYLYFVVQLDKEESFANLSLLEQAVQRYDK